MQAMVPELRLDALMIPDRRTSMFSNTRRLQTEDYWMSHKTCPAAAIQHHGGPGVSL
jgi:hypothetical protein